MNKVLLAIPHEHDKLLISLGTAIANEYILDYENTVMMIYSMPFACHVEVTKFAQRNKSNNSEMLNVCLSCQNPYGLNCLSLERRLINDTNFCEKCWKEFMKD